MHIKNLLAGRLYLIIVILYTGLIAWLSLAKFIIPGDIHVQGGDKIGHLMAYFIFVLIWFFFFFCSKKRNKVFSKSILWAALLGFLYGLLMELLQGTLTNYRSPEWGDILANSSGIIFAVVILKVFENKITKLKSF